MRTVGWLLIGVAIALGIRASHDAGPDAKVARVLAPASPFVGARVCASCHRKEAELWASSAHAKHGQPRAKTTASVDVAIGSTWMQAYMRRDATGRYRIHPLCFDLREQRWTSVATILDAIRGDPGVEADLPPIEFAHRTFEADCAGCHTSGVTVRLEPGTGTMDARWRDVAVDCEACHGPGRAHADAWRALDEARPMVRIGTLTEREQMAVCTRCHGGPPAASDYGPADAKHHIEVSHSLDSLYSSGASSGQTYQAEAFSRSPCHTAAALTCVDCHGPHGRVADPADDSRCTTCHEAEASREHTHHDPSGPGARCVGCHMPRLLDGVLDHQRDHRIDVPRPHAHAPDACTSCHADATKAWARTWITTWWRAPDPDVLEAVEAIHLARTGRIDRARPGLERALGLDDPFFRRTAVALLDRAGDGVDDPVAEVRYAAVEIAGAKDGTDDVLRRAVSDPEPLIRARAWLALFRRGAATGPAPVEDLRVVVREARDSSWAHLFVGAAELEAGRPEAALRLLEHVTALHSELQVAWLALGTAYAELGRDADARWAITGWTGRGDVDTRLDRDAAGWRKMGFPRVAERMRDAVRRFGTRVETPVERRTGS